MVQADVEPALKQPLRSRSSRSEQPTWGVTDTARQVDARIAGTGITAAGAVPLVWTELARHVRQTNPAEATRAHPDAWVRLLLPG